MTENCEYNNKQDETMTDPDNTPRRKGKKRIKEEVKKLRRKRRGSKKTKKRGTKKEKSRVYTLIQTESETNSQA